MTDFHDVWQIGMREINAAYSKVPNGFSTRANHIVIRVLPHGAPKGGIAAAGFYTGSWNREVRRAAAGGAGGPARRGALDGHE